MALSINDFAKNSTIADTRDCMQPLVKAMRHAGMTDDAINASNAILGYLYDHIVPDDLISADDAALIRMVIAQNEAAVSKAEYTYSRPTEWELRGSDNGE